MKCPICVNVDLAMTERQGVEIDYCSKCRGVWLDRGELDKFIELSSPRSQDVRGGGASGAGGRYEKDFDDDDDDDFRRDNRKRKSSLGNFFDF